jgi:hypothetical protein
MGASFYPANDLAVQIGEPLKRDRELRREAAVAEIMAAVILVLDQASKALG